MKNAPFLFAALLFIVLGNTAAATTKAPNTTSHFKVVAAPPPAVLNAFTSLFGNAPVRQWKLRSDGNWRAHFTFKGRAWEATFSPDGTLVKSEPK